MGGKHVTRTASRSQKAFDWSRWYVMEDYVAESPEQGAIIWTLRSSLLVLAGRRRWERVFIGHDNYFSWRQDHPYVRVSPDVYLVDDAPDPPPRSWRTWFPGHRGPRWALEVVSEDWRKDYLDNPVKYSQLGCLELVLFDPEAVRGTMNPERAPLCVFRAEAGGSLRRVYSGPGPAWSEQLRAWMQVRRRGYVPELRLSEDEAGAVLVPTEGDLAKQAEATKAEAETAKAEAEEAKARAAQAQAEAAALRATLGEATGCGHAKRPFHRRRR